MSSRLSTPPGTTTHDGDLIEQSRDEPEIFATIFDRYAPAIHRYLARRLGTALSDDVTAETFLIAFEQRHRYDPSRPDARPWLYGIASNLIRGHRRAEVRMYRTFARTGIDPVTTPSDAERTEEKVSAAAASPRLASALARMPGRDRQALLLFAWADLSYDQIAEALGIPLGTVRSRLNRARRKLREALGGTDPRAVVEEIPGHE